jgi:hypothetical protein
MLSSFSSRLMPAITFPPSQCHGRTIAGHSPRRPSAMAALNRFGGYVPLQGEQGDDYFLRGIAR